MSSSPASEKALRPFETQSADSLLQLIDAGQIGLWEWNLQTNQKQVTQAWAAQLGFTLDELTPIDFDSFIARVHSEDREALRASIQRHAAGEANMYLANFRMRRKDNSWAWIEARGQVTEWTSHGEPLLMSGTHFDISRFKTAEDALHQRSVTDAMTGWYHRTHFLQAGTILVSRALRQQSRVALLMFDIDHLKTVNDQYGHAMGDLVIETLTGRIGERLRSIDIAGRLGGEEFAILLDGAGLGDARTIAETLRETIATCEFNPPHHHPFQVTASFGVTMMNDHNDSMEGLLSRADAALSQAKTNGRNRTELA